MRNPIPASLQDLLTWEKKAIALLGLTLEDGKPHVTPIWFEYVDGRFIINTLRGRVKDRVLKGKPWVSLCILDQDDPNRYLQVQGEVVQETEKDALHQIRRLNEKYYGKYEFTVGPNDQRVTYIIEPRKSTVDV